MYCSLDKIDLTVKDTDGRPSAVQTDHRSPEEIEAEPELSALFAMTRVINARAHFAEEGVANVAVRYAMPGERPPASALPTLRAALAATGGELEHLPHREQLGPASEEAASALADTSFASLARTAAAKVGVRDLGMALRMLEDQTIAAPPGREDDELGYWTRVLELAALAGELLRAKRPGAARWVQTDRSLVPFGFQFADGDGATVMFPANRAQRLVEDGRDESLFKLIAAADEALATPPDAATGRLMPSLRLRTSVDLDEVAWRPLLTEEESEVLPVVVCGVDGETSFGMLRRETLEREVSDVFGVALANLATEPVHQEELHAGGTVITAVGGSFYAAEKLLDAPFMRALQRDLGARSLAAAAPVRGMLLVMSADDPSRLSRFAALARMRYDDGGSRAISPAVLLLTDGALTGFVRETLA